MAIESMEETMTSPLRSPLHDVVDPTLNSDAIVHRQEETGDPPRFLPGTPEMEAKAAVKSSSKPNAATQSENSRAVTWILRNRWRARSVRRASLAARAAAAMFCLLSFSVMAADKGRGWASDSFNRYKEYRLSYHYFDSHLYCLSVNVIGFVYAGFQAYSEVNRRIGDEEIIRRPLRDYFDFAMDQILAYLLISASSSASSGAEYWVKNWGNDPFPRMISGSVAVSFLAFLSFAISSLISAYKLFNRTI